MVIIIFGLLIIQKEVIMKYLRKTSILLIALLFSANIKVLAYCNTTEMRKNNLNEELNLTLINKPKEGAIQVFSHNDKLIYLTKEDLDLGKNSLCWK